jgi:hypothetical protein
MTGTEKDTRKVIAIEEGGGLFQSVFQRVMRMVPDRDRNDKKLQRLLAFRLRQDGEASTHEYLIRRIRDLIRCSYRGSLYDFLKDDAWANACQGTNDEPDPPAVA